ncbi:MAG: hypothetical protein E4H38_04350 [Gemmatimonadales bacterium]|nr:MAG: hypothetical protein E4H38_04350 [Gemmatimonadales bacterium]
MRILSRAPLLAALLFAAVPLAAQEWDGTFVRRDGEPPLTLTLTQDQSGQVSGQLIGPGLVFQLQGAPEGPGIMGRVTAAAGAGWFQAAFAGEDLQLILYDAGPDGSPNTASGQQFFFARSGPPAAPSDPEAAAPEMGAPAPLPDANALDDNTPAGREWRIFLAGKKATKMSRYSSGLEGGYTSRTDVHLCGDGQFVVRDQNSVSVDVGGAYGNAGGNSAQAGTWRILTQGQLAGVELRYGNGAVERYRLEHRDGATYVEGERWLITPSELCGG